MIFKVYYEIGPKHLTDILIKYMPSRKLCSANKELLVVPKHNLKMYRRHAFSVIAPILWNNLPDHIRTTACLGTFKIIIRIKTFLILVIPFKSLLSTYSGWLNNNNNNDDDDNVNNNS